MENLKLAFRQVLGQYAIFGGRATRPEFWWWILAVFLIFIILGLADSLVVAPLLGFGVGDESAGQPLSTVFSLAILLPMLAVGARRLHDTGKSAWLLLLYLIPLIGGLVLIYFYVQPGDDGENAYGPKPEWPPMA